MLWHIGTLVHNVTFSLDIPLASMGAVSIFDHFACLLTVDAIVEYVYILEPTLYLFLLPPKTMNNCNFHLSIGTCGECTNVVCCGGKGMGWLICTCYVKL